jgi:peptidoglycan/LPS O-acetylase OafA/YrhL
MIEKTYRPDIDGLRAVAVLLVMMFHLGLGVPGGYIGVDVFFVISGFLITGIIKRELEQGEFTFAGFYARRARRILPALLTVMLMSTVAALVILLPTDLERYAKSVAAALLSVSNFWFWSQGGYFGAASELEPMLHTWTLAVEEQFYILLPVALMLLYRYTPRWVGRLLLVACVGSFAASAWFVSTRTPEVFYFSPFRAWELLLGSLLALYKLPVVANNLQRQVIAALGLILVVAPAFVLTAVTVFPGPAAALPCIGAALLIWIGTSGESAVGKLLKNRLLVFIGLISYSLYLWHWPLLVFAKHSMGESLKLGGLVGICVASLALASLSWRFVETPFRSTASTTNRLCLQLLSASLVLLFGMILAVKYSHGLSQRFTEQVVSLDRARIREIVRPECIDFRVPLSTNTVCRIGAQGNPTVVVWGDSYAHAMLPAFDTAFKNLGLAVWFLAESGCPPLPLARVSFRGRDNWRCREFNDKVVNFVASQTDLRLVVLTAAWDAYAEESSGYKLRIDRVEDSATSLEQGIESLAQQLQNDVDRRLIVVGQVPTFGWSVPHQMLLAEIKGEPIEPLKREDWLKKSAKSRNIFARIGSSHRITFVSSFEWFCSDDTCRFANDLGQPLYWDFGHINIDGAAFISPRLEETFSQIIQGAVGNIQ